MSHPFFSRMQEPAWKKTEKEVSKKTKGHRKPGSGNCPVASLKGDIGSGDWMIEVKSTKNNSYRLSMDELAKIQREAYQAGKLPAFWIKFEGENRPIIERDWVAIPHSVYLKCMNEITNC